MGPLILKAIEEYCKEKSISKEQLLAVGCSHIGGHKYAGVGIVNVNYSLIKRFILKEIGTVMLQIGIYLNLLRLTFKRKRQWNLFFVGRWYFQLKMNYSRQKQQKTPKKEPRFSRRRSEQVKTQLEKVLIHVFMRKVNFCCFVFVRDSDYPQSRCRTDRAGKSREKTWRLKLFLWVGNKVSNFCRCWTGCRPKLYFGFNWESKCYVRLWNAHGLQWRQKISWF